MDLGAEATEGTEAAAAPPPRRDAAHTAGERITRLALGRRGAAGGGHRPRERLPLVALRREPASPASRPWAARPSPPSAGPWATVTFLAGTEKGELSGWFAGRLRRRGRRAGWCGPTTSSPSPPPSAPLGASTRDKSFVTVGEDGSAGPPPHDLRADAARACRARAEAAEVMITPKGDGLLLARSGRQPGPLRDGQPPSGDHLARPLRQGLVRGLRPARNTSGSPRAPPTTSRPSSA